MTPTRRQFSFSSEGKPILREIARQHLPFDPHDFSLDAAGHLLDQRDVLVRTACASGKTGIIAMLAVFLKELIQQPDLAPEFSVWYENDPIILVVCPTIALEVNIAQKMAALGISATAINTDIERALYKMGARENEAFWNGLLASRVVLLSPEMLKSTTFQRKVGLNTLDSPFQNRCTILVCDEAHLVYIWGRRFREAYGQIGVMRNGLQRRVRLLLMTATLRVGRPLNAIIKTFALDRNSYIDIHLSNLRPEIRVTTSILQASLTTSFLFPEFRWLIGLPGITIIFVPQRNQALRVALYLRNLNPWFSRNVRKYDALNDEATYNADTIKMTKQLDPASEGMIIVSTTVLMVGIDISGVVRVYNVEPEDPDEEIQKEGRLLRERIAGVIAEAYTCISKKRMDDAKKLMATEPGDRVKLLGRDDSAESGTKSRKKALAGGEIEAKVDEAVAWAERLTEPCRSVSQTKLYNNPPYNEPPCQCLLCSATYPLPNPPPCICSGCQPNNSFRDVLAYRKEISALLAQEAVPRALERQPNLLDIPNERPVIDEARALTLHTQNLIKEHLVKLDQHLFDADISNPGGLFTPTMFIPDEAIQTIIQQFLHIASFEDLNMILKSYYLQPEWIRAIWKEITQKIIPSITTWHLQRQENDAEVKRIRELNDMPNDRFIALSGLEPILDVAKIRDAKTTKAALTMELHWHRLWDLNLKRPWSLNKAELVDIVTGAIGKFKSEGRTVEDVRTLLEGRNEQEGDI